MPKDNIQSILQIYRACSEPLYAVLHGIDENRLHWKPAPDSRSISEITRHLIRVDNWFLSRLGYEAEAIDPVDGTAEEILNALKTVHNQIHKILDGCETDAALLQKSQAQDAGERETVGEVVIHSAQHDLYHLAQLIYLRRAQDRDWASPMKQWEAATYVISDMLAPIRNVRDISV